MSKVASSKNLEVRLAAYLIGHLAAEGVCIGAHKTFNLEAAFEAANELLQQNSTEAEMEERCALIAERNLDELRRKIDLATKSEGSNIVSLNLRTQHVKELQSIVSAAEAGNVNAMTVANMRSLGVSAIEARCECGRQMIVDVSSLPGAIEVPALRERLKCVECGERPNDVRPNSSLNVSS